MEQSKPSSGLAAQTVNIKFPSHGSVLEVELCSHPAGEQIASGLRIQGLLSGQFLLGFLCKALACRH